MPELIFGEYHVCFEDGGVLVEKGDRILYRNSRPIYVSVKTYEAIVVFSEIPYHTVSEENGGIKARGVFETGNGSKIDVCDRYSIESGALRISRRAEVIKADPRDLGFATKLSFTLAQSDELLDYDYFSPGQLYLHNEYAGNYALMKNTDLSYYWRKETYSGLPMFAAQHIESGETIAFSRWNADATLPSLDRTSTENYAYVDSKMTVGSFGVSRPKAEALTYTYYGHVMRTPLPEAAPQGLSIDYIYPAVNGQTPAAARGPWNVDLPLQNIIWVHPMRVGFVQDYAIGVTFSWHPDFASMMKHTWREVYPRLKDRLFKVDNAALYRNMIRFLRDITQNFGESWGTPFVAQLPDFDPNSYSAEIGFVGQQAGIGYQLLRWGVLENDEEAIEKGYGILNFWVSQVADDGCPVDWLHLSAHQREPQPVWVRQLGDGLEAILDAYVFEHNRGIEHPEWLEYCKNAAAWLLRRQDSDGSFCRAYTYEGEPCLDSKASTPCIIRFFVQLYLVTGNESLRRAAIRAGDWTYENETLGFEYRGGTCDQSDVMDKESGIYAMFAFIALYDLEKNPRYLEAACAAADYVETFTFVWNFPVDMPYPCHPFARNHISGTSNVTVGVGGGDVYMAACSYVYYRLYLLSGDPQYRDFAEFIHKNVKQANDIDGSCGYKYIGLVNEGGSISEQQYRGRYHWLPWCTFVEVDPAARMFDTFGVYEIDEAEKLPLEERLRRNEIYTDYCL